jgi:hypothetical protein
MDKPWERVELAQTNKVLPSFLGEGGGGLGAQKFIRAEYFRNFWVLFGNLYASIPHLLVF